jgi:hypothetical protein
MTFGLNTLMLFGLAALIIPPLIHLLNRRRYDVVDWGAMQFLQVSETTRRRLLIEELLLMLLRMGLIALMVLALAAPHAVSPFFAQAGGRPGRDVVLIFDGSYSMGSADAKGKTAHEAAKEWALTFLSDLKQGDSVAVLQAKQQVVPVLADPTKDLEKARDAITRLPAPRGGCDWPRALREAHKILAARGNAVQGEIIALSDGQRYGWADGEALFHWEMLRNNLRAAAAKTDETIKKPRVWVVNVAADRPTNPPNYALLPLASTRAVAGVGQRLKFKSAIAVSGEQSYEPPHRIRLEVDGKPVARLKPPAQAPLSGVQVPLTFSQRFLTPGSHLVSVILEPDPPEEKRPKGYRLKDTLPGDNRQDMAIEIVDALPVLLVDGDTRLSKESSTFFLDQALSQSPDPKKPPIVRTRTVPFKQFEPSLLKTDLDKNRPGSRPHVLVLADVPKLSAGQQNAIARFLEEGGGVLVIVSERVETERAFYNKELYRGGRGWLPAQLDQVMGEQKKPELAAAPDLRRFHHPSLELLREKADYHMDRARFPRWWKVSVPPGQNASVPVALLTTTDPLLVEKPYRGGRVLLCTVPLDESWGANLPSLPALPVLAHELVYYLADTRAAEHNLKPGQPIRYRLPPALAEAGEKQPSLLLVTPPEGGLRLYPYAAGKNGEDANGVGALPHEVVWQVPGQLERRLKVELTPLQHESLRDTGVYHVRPAHHSPLAAGGYQLNLIEGAGAYYVVQPDHRESDLTPATPEDRKKVASLVPLEYQNEQRPVAQAMVESSETQDLWWWLMIGVVLLLCSEVWMTRRMVKGREVPA